MSEPEAAIFAVSFVCMAGLAILLAARGRFRPSSGRVGRIVAATSAITSLGMALVVLSLSSPAIFGLSWAIRGPAVLIVFLVMFLAYVTAVILLADPALAAWLHIPAWLYTWLHGVSDHHE